MLFKSWFDLMISKPEFRRGLSYFCCYGYESYSVRSGCLGGSAGTD